MVCLGVGAKTTVIRSSMWIWQSREHGSGMGSIQNSYVFNCLVQVLRNPHEIVKNEGYGKIAWAHGRQAGDPGDGKLTEIKTASNL